MSKKKTMVGHLLPVERETGREIETKVTKEWGE